MKSSSSSLHTIASFPLDPHNPLYEHYPAMKLGVRESVRHYATLLAPLAETILASEPETTEWVLTAPPLYVIPAGANLMLEETYRILRESRRFLKAVDLRYARPNPGSRINLGGDYANARIDVRVGDRKMLFESDWAPRPDPADFRDRAVLVVNDINVTGTQQEFIHRMLESVHPASIHWLYLIQVDAAVGRSHPEVEYSLNHVNLETVEDFAEVLRRPDVDYTARCIRRLFGHPEATLEMLLRSMEPQCLERLHRLLIEEGTYDGEENATGLALLRKYAGG